MQFPKAAPLVARARAKLPPFSHQNAQERVNFQPLRLKRGRTLAGGSP